MLKVKEFSLRETVNLPGSKLIKTFALVDFAGRPNAIKVKEILLDEVSGILYVEGLPSKADGPILMAFHVASVGNLFLAELPSPKTGVVTQAEVPAPEAKPKKVKEVK